MMSPKEKHEFCLLVLKSLEQTVTAEETRLLEDYLANRSDAVGYYGDCIELYLQMRKPGQFGSRVTVPLSADQVLDMEMWSRLSEHEKTAPIVAVEKPEPAPAEPIRVQEAVVGRKINKWSLYSALVSTAALIFLIVFINLFPRYSPNAVATLTEEVNAVWKEGRSSLKGSRLYPQGESTYLLKGCAEVTFDEGATVTIEGPAEFEIQSSSQLCLRLGRIYASVPHRAIGFTVLAGGSKIIDLGTEFGVQVDLQGDTELHVMKGMTRLISGLEGPRVNMDVREGAAKKLSGITGQMHDISLNEKMFVRSIDTQRQFAWKGQALSLADIVGGGNGFTGGVLKAGIDVTTGQRTAPQVHDYMGQGTADYQPVDFSPYVDGVFIPGAGEGDTQITADGSLTFMFPTNSGSYWGYIFNGSYHKSQNVEEHPLRLNGMVFDGRENAAITIHSNQGITFDLSRIRRDLPGFGIPRFRSLIGVSQTVSTYFTGEGPSHDHAVAGFWVLLDGQPVYQGQLTDTDRAVGLDIPIPAGTRYLTLAVTEADGTVSYDWALFGNPELVLESSEATADNAL